MKKNTLTREISKKIFLIVAILVLHTIYFIFHAVHAQSVSLSLTPPLVELLIKPGKTVVIPYTVTNTGDPVVVVPNVTSFSPKGIMGSVSLRREIVGPVRFNLDNSDITFENGVFLKTGARRKFLLKIRVPENAPSGDYYYTFYIKTDPGPLFTGKSISKSTVVVGSNILITISKTYTTENKGSISSFDLENSVKLTIFGHRYNIVDSLSAIPFSMIVKNNGHNYIKPHGEILVRGPLGTVSKHTIIPVNILAGSSRIVPATPTVSPDCTNHTRLCNVPHSFILKGFFIGKQSLGATILFAPGASPAYASTSFIAIPYRLMVVIIIIFIVLNVLVVRFHILSQSKPEL